MRRHLLRLARRLERSNRWYFLADGVWELWDYQGDLRYRWFRRWWFVRATGHRLVTSLLRLGNPAVQDRNSDKPHRCPECHAVECTYPKRFYRLYRCVHCQAVHWPGWRWQRWSEVIDRCHTETN